MLYKINVRLSSTFVNLLFCALFFFVVTGLSSEEKTGTAPFSQHNGVYLIAGYGDLVDVQTIQWLSPSDPRVSELLSARQLFQLKFSTKFQLFNEYKSGLFLAYTQKSFWNLLGDSSPFTETNYNPEMFFRFKTLDNFAGDVNLGLLDHIQVGLFHESTGVAGAQSRGYDKVYAELGLGAGDSFRIDVTGRYYLYLYQFMPAWYTGETLDMQMYRSNMEFSAGLTFADETLFFLPKKVSIKGAPGGGFNAFDWTQGYAQAEVLFGSLFGGLSPYAQLFYGHGEGLVNYDQLVTSFRVGIYAE